jgi:hypothetical protein
VVMIKPQDTNHYKTKYLGPNVREHLNRVMLNLFHSEQHQTQAA